MNKEIKINPDLFSSTKKNKTVKKPNKQLKKELLQKLTNNEVDILSELESLTNPIVPTESEPTQQSEQHEQTETNVKIEKEPLHGCLKNGTKPTLRQLKQTPKTVKQYTSFGKKNNTVRILIKDKHTYAKIDKDIKKLEKHSMTDIRTYLREKKLYKVGSTAPDDVLREIYKNAQLTGNVENKNDETMVHNYLNESQS
jgi:hypothetical protein